MTVVIASTPEPKNITGNQERLEAIFHTIDTIKADLNKCCQKGSLMIKMGKSHCNSIAGQMTLQCEIPRNDDWIWQGYGTHRHTEALARCLAMPPRNAGGLTRVC